LATRILPISPKDIERITEVDCSQKVKAVYRAQSTSKGLGLSLKRVSQNPPIEIPAWGKLGIRYRIERWRPLLEKGGLMMGAFDGERLVGFSILGPTYKDGSAEMAALFIHADYRGSGIGTSLMSEIESVSDARGVKVLYVYSKPTGASVEFLVRHGFRVIGLLDKTRVVHLPWDIVFLKDMGKAAKRNR
jgi:ribosomal protein S18 acetylase RimI-like enzyme